MKEYGQAHHFKEAYMKKLLSLIVLSIGLASNIKAASVSPIKASTGAFVRVDVSSMTDSSNQTGKAKFFIETNGGNMFFKYTNGITTTTAYSTNIDSTTFANLNTPAQAYRRPRLSYNNATTVDVEGGLNGVAQDIQIIFPDGEKRITNAGSFLSYSRFDITRNARWVAGTPPRSGLRGALSEATDTWYALYAVKTATDSKFVIIGDTVTPTSVTNFNYLSSTYSTNGWVYLGLIRNGDSSAATGDIISFTQTGDMTLFTNTVAAGSTGRNGHGILFANATSATSTDYTFVNGMSGDVVPPSVGNFLALMNCNVGSAGACNFYFGGTNVAQHYSTSNIVISAPIPEGQSFGTDGPASSNFNLYFYGFYDYVLSGGQSPY
jgi:hypothetical protein